MYINSHKKTFARRSSFDRSALLIICCLLTKILRYNNSLQHSAVIITYYAVYSVSVKDSL